jgi:hypothetical protein
VSEAQRRVEHLDGGVEVFGADPRHPIRGG